MLSETPLTIEVNGDIEAGLRLFRKLVERDGTFKILKRRELCPNLTDRRKMKEIVEIQRRKRKERMINSKLGRWERGRYK